MTDSTQCYFPHFDITQREVATFLIQAESLTQIQLLMNALFVSQHVYPLSVHRDLKAGLICPDFAVFLLVEWLVHNQLVVSEGGPSLTFEHFGILLVFDREQPLMSQVHDGC